VTVPLTYQAMNQEDTTLIAGIRVNKKLTPKFTILGSIGVEQDLVNNAAAIQASATGLTLTSAALAGSYQATRPTASLGFDYEIAPAKRLGFNMGLNQSAYASGQTNASAMLSYTAGF
jgi:hypothetical protein